MTDRDAPGVVAPPPLIYASAFALGLGLDAGLPSIALPRPLAAPVGAALLAGGGLLAGSFIAAFRRARTPVDPRRPATALVTTGPYRVSRNPGYLGLTLVYAGGALLADTAWPLVTLLPALAWINRGVIAREESYLERKFGEHYVSYKARVRRWI